MQVPRELLATPTVRYLKKDGKGKEKSETPTLASWNLRDRHFHEPAKQGQVGIIDCRYNTGDVLVSSIAGALKIAFNDLGMGDVAVDQLSNQFSDIWTWTETVMIDKLRSIHSKYKICLVILPEHDKWKYSQLKRVFDIKIGVHTVCVTADKVKRSLNDMNFFANLALKFNLKLGGINHVVEDRLKNKPIGEFLLEKFIVLGADVVHPPQGSRLGTPSIAAVVGNSDSSVANFPGSMRLNPGGQEVHLSLPLTLK